MSALQEIELARSLLSGPDPACPQLRYYCMGFYIHSCPKMRYKAAFQPSELLCPETFCWVPFERLRAALDAHRYVAFSQVPHALDGLAEEHGVIEAAPQDPTALEVGILGVLNHTEENSLLSESCKTGRGNEHRHIDSKQVWRLHSFNSARCMHPSCISFASLGVTLSHLPVFLGCPMHVQEIASEACISVFRHSCHTWARQLFVCAASTALSVYMLAGEQH